MGKEETPSGQSEETIGSILRNTRIKKGEDLDKIVEITKIRKKYIEALESNNFKIIPNLLVAKGFMKIYAEYLGLNVELLLKIFAEHVT